MPEQGGGYVVHEGCDHIFFVGFLGAGKSTLARNLGSLFHRPHVAETRELARLASRKSLLVSCGGGIVERPENCALMHEMGAVLFLDGDLEDSLRQIRCPERRPDLGTAEHAARVYHRRRPLYEGVADLTIDIRNKTFEQVAHEAGQLLWERGLL